MNNTKLAILGLLAIEPMSGYGIKKMIAESVGFFWSESNGQIYPALHHLLSEKYITLHPIEKKDKKSRKIYAITSKGQSALKKWLELEPITEIHRDENLLKIFFGKNISSTCVIQHLEKRKKELMQQLKKFEKIFIKIQTWKHSPHYVYWLLTLNNGMSLSKAELTWCNESIQTLKKLQT